MSIRSYAGSIRPSHVLDMILGGHTVIKSTKKNLTLLSTMLMGPISLVLLIIAVYLIQPKVEAKLTSSVKSVLEQNNIDADVSFSGRDGILKGSVESQEVADNAEKLSLSVFGTRVIRNKLSVKDQDHSQESMVEKIIATQNARIKEAAITEYDKESKTIKSVVNKPQSEKGIALTETKPKEVNSFAVAGDTTSGYTSEVDKIMANMQQMNLRKKVVKADKDKKEDVKKVEIKATSPVKKTVIEPLALEKVIVKEVIPPKATILETSSTQAPKAIIKTAEVPTVKEKDMLETSKVDKLNKQTKTSVKKANQVKKKAKKTKKSTGNEVGDIINDFNMNLGF